MLQNQTIRIAEVGNVLYTPAVIDPTKKYPLIIFAHGVGQQVGDPATQTINNMYDDGLPKALKGYGSTPAFTPPFECIIICPQAITYSVDPAWLSSILDEAHLRWPIDDQRIYLSGISGGGWLCWSTLLDTNISISSKIAAMVILSGQFSRSSYNIAANLDRIITLKTPILSIIGGGDTVISVPGEHQLSNDLNARVPGICTYVERPGYTHCCWVEIYDNTWLTVDTVTPAKVNIWDWMYSYTLGSFGANQTPTPTPSLSITPTVTPSLSVTPTITQTLTPTLTPNASLTPTPSITPSHSVTPSVTPTISSSAVFTQIKIEAENFTGGANKTGTQTCTDAGGGLQLGILSSGYTDYSVTIPTARTYPIGFRIATPNTGCAVQLRKTDGTVLCTVSVSNTGGWGGSSYSTFSGSATLSVGTQTLRVYNSGTATFNINWITIG